VEIVAANADEPLLLAPNEERLLKKLQQKSAWQFLAHSVRQPYRTRQRYFKCTLTRAVRR
jgi:hypothetical protein